MFSIQSASKKLVLTLAAITSVGLTGCNDVQKALSILWFPAAVITISEMSQNSEESRPPRCTVREEEVCTSTRDRYGYESGRECHVVRERYCSRRMYYTNSTGAQFNAEGLASKYGWSVATSNEIYNYFSEINNLVQTQNKDALTLQVNKLGLSAEDYFNMRLGVVSDELAAKFATKFNVSQAAAQSFLRDLFKKINADIQNESQGSVTTSI